MGPGGVSAPGGSSDATPRLLLLATSAWRALTDPPGSDEAAARAVVDYEPEVPALPPSVPPVDSPLRIDALLTRSSTSMPPTTAGSNNPTHRAASCHTSFRMPSFPAYLQGNPSSERMIPMRLKEVETGPSGSTRGRAAQYHSVYERLAKLGTEEWLELSGASEGELKRTPNVKTRTLGQTVIYAQERR